MTDPEDLYALARDAGLAAAALVRENRPTGRVPVAATKSSDIDVVTLIDRQSEEIIRDRILTARPDDSFVGEEGNDVIGTSGVEWVVDPIDGTVNFVYGIPRYAVAIGARVDGAMTVAVVINIATGAEFGAILGKGSWRLEKDARLALPGPPATSLDQALVATGFSYLAEVRERQGPAVAALVPQVRDIRRFGAAALDLVDIAGGVLDAYFEQGLHPWDHEPAGLIAREAGADVRGLDGPPDWRFVLACHPSRSREYLDLVRACGF